MCRTEPEHLKGFLYSYRQHVWVNGQKKIMLELIILYYLAYCERFEPRSHFITKCQSTVSHCQQWSNLGLGSPR